jgi:hypothetical protein
MSIVFMVIRCVINKSSDWKLSASSPVINKGANVGLTSDFSGNPLVGLPDMGAFEITSCFKYSCSCICKFCS